MIHFFPTYSKHAKNSPFAEELVALGIDHRLFPGEVHLRYRSRIWLMLRGWPSLGWFALNSAIRSLVLSKPYPDTVVVGSDIESIVFGIIRALLFRRKPEIVLLGFILTSRNNPAIDRMRRQYFRFVFSMVDKVICHSTLEMERYAIKFQNSRTKFLHVPYGLHVSGRTTQASPSQRPYILSAGRSGRDYATLFRAVEDLPIDLHVICDNEDALKETTVPPNVSVLRSCYGEAYVEELRNALFVVIPLGVNDISAGQMVLIQSMAFAKPTIITRTATVEEYVTDGEQSLLVEQGNVAELRNAMRRLLSDSELAAHLSSTAASAFENRFCMKAFVRNLVACISQTED